MAFTIKTQEEFVVYIEKDNGRKKLLHTKKSQRAANMFLTKNADKILNQSGIRAIGSMSKFRWEKDEAQYAENIKKVQKMLDTHGKRPYIYVNLKIKRYE